MDNDAIITKAIKYCERLYDIYDDNGEITDMDIAYLVEILKGREWGVSMEKEKLSFEVISKRRIYCNEW